MPSHKLFIDHLKVLDKFETSDLDLDLQGQIYLESLNVFVICCEFGTGALDLDHQGQIGLQTLTVFKKIETFFITPSNLKCELIIYWI